jgi:tetratricopeptide (TPR) repeat protein
MAKKLLVFMGAILLLALLCWAFSGTPASGGDPDPNAPPPADPNAPPPANPTPPAPTGPVKYEKSEYFKPPEGTPEEAIKLMKEVEQTYEGAKKATTSKEVKKAMETMVSKCKKARKVAPDWIVVGYYLCIAYQGQQKYTMAKTEVDAILAKAPKWHEALLELGDIYLWLKQYDQSKKTYDDLIALKPDWSTAYLRRVGMHIRVRDLKSAKEDIQKALQLGIEDPKEKEGYEKVVTAIDNEMNQMSKWGQTFTKESEHYIIMTNDSQSFADDISKHLELIYKAYTKLYPANKFAKRDEKFIIIIHGSQQDYFNAGAEKNTGGYFSTMSKKVVIYKYPSFDAGVAVLYHECFHQYLDTMIPNPPLWFNEGHAEFYGAFKYLAGKNQMLYRPNGSRLPGMKQIFAARQNVPLKEFTQFTQEEFYNQQTIGRNYAQAWAFVYFCNMFADGKYKKLLTKYFNTMIKMDKTYDEIWDATFKGVDWDTMEQEFRTYISGLKESDASKPMGSR